MRRDLRDVVIVILVAISVALSVLGRVEDRSTLNRVKRDESATHVQAAHTRAVQVQGGPVAVCLRLGIERALPALERLPGTAPPFEEYVRLQGHRYEGIGCPGVSGP